MGGILVACLLLEGILRLYFLVTHRDIRLYRPSVVSGLMRGRFTSHPFLPFASRPLDSRKLFVYREEIGQTLEVDIKTNSLGFRTEDRPFEKPPGTKRVIVLGGSTTMDGPTNQETWPALLEKKLNETYPNTRIEVINFGLDMGSSPMSLINLEFIGVEYSPDLIISYDGVNDSNLMGYESISPDYRNILNRYDPNKLPLQARLPAWAFHSYFISVCSRKLDDVFYGPQEIYHQVIWNNVAKLKPSRNELEGVALFERNLRLMRAAAREYESKFLAATPHWVTPSEKVNRLNDELRRFFQRAEIDYVDLDGLLPHDDWSLHVDQVHWSRKGLETVAERFKEKIVADDLLGLKR
ncbi:MAG TPA: SGNH/GDSL hydrolase family protein [Pyrinomonadaceae bacterium]